MIDIKEYKDKLVDVLHDDVFSELMNFWKEVEESQYDYKIFVSKKCYVLYKVFMPLLECKTFEPCVKITDTAIPLYYKKMIDKTVLIVDDVFIHGKTSLKISEQIKPYAKSIDFYVFAKNNNQEQAQDISTQRLNDKVNEYMHQEEKLSDGIDEKIFESFFKIIAKDEMEKDEENSLLKQSKYVKGYINCNKDYQWKKISDLIMKSIWSINMPYVSYLPIFIFHDVEKLFLLNESSKYQKIICPRHEKLQLFFNYYVETSENDTANIYYCFVISVNNFVNNCKVTPMVFFDCENTSINRGFINEGLNTIYGDMAEPLVSIFPQNVDNNNDKGLISMLQYLIFSVGYLATIRWFNREGIEEDEYDIEYTNARFSFGEHIQRYIERLSRITEYEKILNEIEQSTIKNFEKNNNTVNILHRKTLLNELDKAYESMKSCKMEKDCLPIVDVLSKYFKYNNMIDEENIYNSKQENYVRGLKFSEIKECLKQKGFLVTDIISGLMYQYNMGSATIDFLYDYNDKGEIVGINMYWRAGEQSYKCIANTYVLPVYFQNLYNRIFSRRIATFLYEIFLEIMEVNYSLMEIPFSKSDFEKYCGIKDDVYDAFDIEEYCEEKQFKYLGFLGKQMEQYILFGNIEEAHKNDKIRFKRGLFDFLKMRTDDEALHNCKKILWNEKDMDVYL